MPSTVLNSSRRFPVGTSVKAYKQALVGQHKDDNTAPDDQTAAETAVVAADSTLTFAALVSGDRYSAYALIGSKHTYVDFIAD